MALLLPPFPQNDTSWVGSAVRASANDFMRQTAFSLAMAQDMGKQISGAGEQLAKSIFDRKKLAMAADQQEHKKRIDYLKLALDERKTNASIQNDTVRAAASMLRATKPAAARSSTAKVDPLDAVFGPAAASPEASGEPALPTPGTAAGAGYTNSENLLLPDVDPARINPATGASPNPPLDTVMEPEASPAPAAGQPMPTPQISPTQEPDETSYVPQRTAPSVDSVIAPEVTEPNREERLGAIKERLGPQNYETLYSSVAAMVGDGETPGDDFYKARAIRAQSTPDALPYMDAVAEAIIEKNKEAKASTKSAEDAAKFRQDRVEANRKTQADIQSDISSSEALIDIKFPPGTPGHDEAKTALERMKGIKQPFLTQFAGVLDDIELKMRPGKPKTMNVTALTALSNHLENKKADLDIAKDKAEIELIDSQLKRINDALAAEGERQINRALVPETSSVVNPPVSTPAAPRPTPAASKPYSKYLR